MTRVRDSKWFGDGRSLKKRLRPPAPQIPLIELQERRMDLGERALNIARMIDDDVLQVMAVDTIKNALLLGAPGSTTDMTSGGTFQTHEVLESLGFNAKEIRSKVSYAGRLLSQAYKDQTGKDPMQTDRIIDGTKRTVKAYPASWFESARQVLLQQYKLH
jgi:hypothetical protein